MKKNLFYAMSLMALFSLGSCSQEDLADAKQEDGVKLGVESVASINITSSRGTGAIETEYLPDNAQIGVWLRGSDSEQYDNNTYPNLLYTATGTTSQTWNSLVAPDLSKTTGKAYAYYPYDANAGTDITKIPVDLSTGDTDFMYSVSPATVSYNSPKATFSMRHLCAMIRIKFLKGTYEGDCVLQNIKIEGNSSKGTFNLITNTYTPIEDDKKIQRELYDDFSGAEGATVDLLVYPKLNNGAYLENIYFNLDDSYNADYGSILSEPIPNMQAGKIYNITVTVNRSPKDLKVSSVSVEPWSVESTYNVSHTENI